MNTLRATSLLPIFLVLPACGPSHVCIGNCPDFDDATGATGDPSTEAQPTDSMDTDQPGSTTMDEPLGTSTMAPPDGEDTADEFVPSCDIPDSLGPFTSCNDGQLTPDEQFCYTLTPEGLAGLSFEAGIASTIAGRFDAGGGTDLIVAHADGTLSTVLDDDPFGFQFTPALISSVELPAPFQLTAAGDFDEDGHLDIAGRFPGDAGDIINVLLLDSVGQLRGAQAFSQDQIVFGPAIGDWNLDHHLDLVVISPSLDAGVDDVIVLYGDGTGKFTIEVEFSAGVSDHLVAMGDLHGDGRGNDWVFVEPNGDTDLQLSSPGDVFLSRQLGPDLVARDVKIGDLGGDARGDVVVLTDDTAHGTSTMHVLLQSGPLEEPDFVVHSYPVVCGAASLALGQLDGDGALDIAIVGPDDPTIMIRANDGQGGFDDVIHKTLATGIEQLHLVDASGDGAPDILGVSPGKQSIFWLTSFP